MNVDQLLLVLPNQARLSGGELHVNQWGSIIDHFAAQGGRELVLGGSEPLAFAGFWVLVRRGLKAGLPRVTAYLSGSLLEPWVMRSLVESGIHVLVALDSLQADPHETLHGPGTHARAMAAVDLFLKQGLLARTGVLATATRVNHAELPVLAAWAAGRGLARFLWTSEPEGGWPSPQLRALRLSPEEKTDLAMQMHAVARGVSGGTYVGPLDMVEDPALQSACSPVLRVDAMGDAFRGFAGEGGYLGSLKRTPMSDLLARGIQAAGD